MENKLEIGGNTIIGIESGVDSVTGIKWTKFSDGTMIQYGRFTVDLSNQAFKEGSFALPFSFVGLPATSITTAYTSNTGYIFRCSASVPQNGSTLDWSIGTYNNSAVSVANRNFDYIIIGRWK